MAKYGLIGRTYQHIKRYREITGVLMKYGFEDLLSAIQLRKRFPFVRKIFKRKKRKAVADRTRWERMRMVLEELGPTFVKFGQVMSNRPDLLPLELIEELEKLQDKVPPFPYKDLEKIVEVELDRPLDKVFKRVDKKPLAAASIAQVHRAVLKSGEEVVIKVQRPGIRQKIEVDLDIMYNLAMLIERYMASLAVFHPTSIVRKFEETINKEMRFTLEAGSIKRFGEQFKKEPSIYVPDVYSDLTTERVLVMEYVEGIKVSDKKSLKEQHYDMKEIARRGADLFMQQVFVHGFFHADPHPGNVLVLEGNVVCFIDFGMMGLLLDEDREQLGSIIIGIQTNDTKRIIRALQRISIGGEIKDKKALSYALHELIADYQTRSLKQIDVATIVYRFRDIIVRHNMQIPPDFYLLIKALTTIEGVGRTLDPDFNAFKYLRPYVIRIMRERLSPKNLLRKFYLWVADAGLFLQEFPNDVKEVLEKLKHGKVHVEIEHTGLDPLQTTLDRITNRVVIAIILSSLLIASSLIILSDIPPKWWGVPTIGVIGYLIAGFIGLGLLITIFRRGKM